MLKGKESVNLDEVSKVVDRIKSRNRHQVLSLAVKERMEKCYDQYEYQLDYDTELLNKANPDFNMMNDADHRRFSQELGKINNRELGTSMTFMKVVKALNRYNHPTH